MIEFMKLTGKVEEDYLEVRCRTGETLLAPMMNVGTSTSLPTEIWVGENRDNFIAIVSYEHDSYNKPLVLGFLPVKGAKSEDFDVIFQLMNLMDGLLELLLSVKTNTMLGPQPFFPDNITKVQEIKLYLQSIKERRLNLKK